MRQPGPCVRALCEAVARMLSKNMTCARPRCKATPSEDFPHTSHCTLCTSHSTLHLKACELFSPHLSSSHLIPSLLTCHQSKFNCFHLIRAMINLSHLLQVQQSLHKALPSTTLHYKACTKHFPVLLCTTKLAQSTSVYYFVLQSLHKVLPCITLYYKACTKYFPVLLCATKLAQSTSLYYFVLQSLHKALPSTTLCYKACAKYVPVYFVLQSLHKALPSTTLYCKACTKYSRVLLCTTKLAQSTCQYYFVLYDFETLFKRNFKKENRQR